MYVGDLGLRTIVVVASRDIEDEELWLDYNFKSDKDLLPEWYCPVNHDASTSHEDDLNAE